MRTIVLASLLCSVGFGVRLSAHDFWLAVTTPVGATRPVLTANVGEHFPTATNYTAPERVDQFRFLGPRGDVPLEKTFRRQADSLAADLPVSAPGAYLVVMTIAARVADMKGDEFTDYLKEEGLDAIIAERAKAGESAATARERYARYAKAVVRTGAGDAAHLVRPTGLKAEFVPSSDPTAVRPGGALTLQLLADGKPVANADIAALHDSGAPAAHSRSDGNGRVTVTLDRPGQWLLRTVHMVRTPRSDSEAGWESYWVTLALRVEP